MGLPSNLSIAPRLGTYTSLHRLAAVPDEISMPIGALIPASSLSSCPSFSMCSFHDRLALVRRHSWPVPICVLVGFKQYARKQIVWGTAHTHTNTHTHTNKQSLADTRGRTYNIDTKIEGEGSNRRTISLFCRCCFPRQSHQHFWRTQKGVLFDATALVLCSVSQLFHWKPARTDTHRHRHTHTHKHERV